jgi:hypothetical protein
MPIIITGNIISYRDSIVNDGTLTKIAELQTKYETEKKDAQIIQLNNEQTIQQLELEKAKSHYQW